VDSPLYSEVWEDADLSKRDRSLITVATLVALGHTDELPAHLNRAIANGVTRTELAAAITHLAFYAGFPAAITASVIANKTLARVRSGHGCYWTCDRLFRHGRSITPALNRDHQMITGCRAIRGPW